MSAAPALMVHSAAHRPHPGGGSLFGSLIMFGIVILAGAALLPFVTTLIKRVRSKIRSRRAERRRLRLAAGAELRARAMMSELCPAGWLAQITIFEGPDWQVPEELEKGRVALDWAELEPGTGRPLVTRQVAAPTIAEALEAMIIGRCTDETLEQIERGAASDGVLWSDL